VSQPTPLADHTVVLARRIPRGVARRHPRPAPTRDKGLPAGSSGVNFGSAHSANSCRCDAAGYRCSSRDFTAAALSHPALTDTRQCASRTAVVAAAGVHSSEPTTPHVSAPSAPSTRHCESVC
jgi:hypothetical protein